MDRSYEERGEVVSRGPGAVQADTAQTFEEFYVREFKAVVRLAYALSGSRSASEDLAQDAFLAAHRRWDRIGSYERPDIWVRRTVANMSMSLLRRRYAEARALARLTIRREAALPELPGEDAEFWAAVRTLPRRQAQVVALRYVDDRQVAEIAQILGTAEGTVKKHLHDARHVLIRRLQLEEARDDI